MQNRRRPFVVPITTPLFTANQGAENDEFNRRCLPTNRQQDQFEKSVYDPIATMTRRYDRGSLPETCKFLARPKLKKIVRAKKPPAYRSPVKPDGQAEELLHTTGIRRIVSTMPEPPSQRHENCFDRNYEPKRGENVNDLWIEPTIPFGAINANTQQKLLEEKLDESLKKCCPRKWKMDIEDKIAEEKLVEDVAVRMKDFAAAGYQLPFIPCERATRVPLTTSSEIWRLKPIQPGGGGGGGGGGGIDSADKIKLLMSKLHKEDWLTQRMMETSSSLGGPGNRIRAKCAGQEYTSRPLGRSPRWQDDVVSPWSQLHGYAIPNLQTLPETLRRNKTMSEAAWKAPRPEANDTAAAAATATTTETPTDANVEAPETTDEEVEEVDELPPPPDNSPLPPPLITAEEPEFSPPAEEWEAGEAVGGGGGGAGTRASSSTSMPPPEAATESGGRGTEGEESAEEEAEKEAEVEAEDRIPAEETVVAESESIFVEENGEAESETEVKSIGDDVGAETAPRNSEHSTDADTTDANANAPDGYADAAEEYADEAEEYAGADTRESTEAADIANLANLAVENENVNSSSFISVIELKHCPSVHRPSVIAEGHVRHMSETSLNESMPPSLSTSRGTKERKGRKEGENLRKGGKGGKTLRSNPAMGNPSEKPAFAESYPFITKD